MLIIDGHNLIGAMPNIKISDHHAKEKLLDLLKKYQKTTHKKITVVFDGKGYGGFEINKFDNIEVRYPNSGSTADEVIKNMLLNKLVASQSSVISSDNEIIELAKIKQVKYINSREFSEEIESIFDDQSEQQKHDRSKTDITGWLKYFGKK